jgi:hypothetical protein
MDEVTGKGRKDRMDRAKHRLKVVGLLLIIGAILSAMIWPAFSPGRHSGMSQETRARGGVLGERMTVLGLAVSSALMGAGLSLLIAGCALRQAVEPRSQSDDGSANHRVVPTS